MFVNYIGNYDYYLEKRDDVTKAALALRADASLNPSEEPAGDNKDTSEGGKADWQAQKQEAAEKRKIQNAIKKTEEEIDRLETRNTEIDEEFLKPEVSTDPEKLRDLSEEQKANSEKLEELYAKWEELSE
jgi:ATP-binding cassette subfamily F protein 3